MGANQGARTGLTFPLGDSQRTHVHERRGAKCEVGTALEILLAALLLWMLCMR